MLETWPSPFVSGAILTKTKITDMLKLTKEKYISESSLTHALQDGVNYSQDLTVICKKKHNKVGTETKLKCLLSNPNYILCKDAAEQYFGEARPDAEY